MFESTPATVMMPDLSAESLRRLYDEVERRLSRPSEAPLVLLDGNLPKARLQELAARLETRSGVDLVLATSGSRSRTPHLVGLTWDAVVASANATRRYLGRDGTWWLNLPAHHIAGLQVVVRSVLSGTMPFLSLCDAAPGPLYGSLVPTQLSRIPTAELERFEALLIGGARLDSALRRAAGSLPIVTTYGMTETCGGCVYDGKPLPEVRVMVRDSRVHVAGPMLMSGYLDEVSPLVDVDDQRWLATEDLGSWDGATLTIAGRADDVIVSGGENVPAFAVQDAILEAFPALRTVEVVGVPDSTWGQVVAAVVVSEAASAAALGPPIRAAVSEALGQRYAPRLVVTLPALPLLPGGKVDQQELLSRIRARIGAGDAWQR